MQLYNYIYVYILTLTFPLLFYIKELFSFAPFYYRQYFPTIYISWEMFYGESSWWCIFSNAISNDSVTKVIMVQLILQRFSAHSSECTKRATNEQVATNWLGRLTTNRKAKQVFVAGTAGYDLCVSSWTRYFQLATTCLAESKSITYVIRRCNARIHERARVLIVIEHRWTTGRKRAMYRQR